MSKLKSIETKFFTLTLYEINGEYTIKTIANDLISNTEFTNDLNMVLSVFDLKYNELNNKLN